VIERSFGSSIDRERIRGRGAPYPEKLNALGSAVSFARGPPQLVSALAVYSPASGNYAKRNANFQGSLLSLESSLVRTTYELAARQFATGPLAVFFSDRDTPLRTAPRRVEQVC